MMKLMAAIKPSTCPRCGVPNQCAMSQGNSISSCWCTNQPTLPLDTEQEVCYCKSCLNELAQELGL